MTTTATMKTLYVLPHSPWKPTARHFTLYEIRDGELKVLWPDFGTQVFEARLAGNHGNADRLCAKIAREFLPFGHYNKRPSESRPDKLPAFTVKVPYRGVPHVQDLGQALARRFGGPFNLRLLTGWSDAGSIFSAEG